MDMQKLETILNYVVAFLSSGVGATLIGVIVKLFLNYKGKKFAKLTEQDEERISKKTAQIVLNAIEGGVSIDADALVDKATNKRLDGVEGKFNDLVTMCNEQMNVLVKLGQVVLELKSPSLASRGELATALGTSIPKLNAIAVPEQAKLYAKSEVTDAVEAVDEKVVEEKAKLTY